MTQFKKDLVSSTNPVAGGLSPASLESGTVPEKVAGDNNVDINGCRGRGHSQLVEDSKLYLATDAKVYTLTETSNVAIPDSHDLKRFISKCSSHK